jgi:hypothetical protein
MGEFIAAFVFIAFVIAQFLSVPAGGLYDERPAAKTPPADSQASRRLAE